MSHGEHVGSEARATHYMRFMVRIPPPLWMFLFLAVAGIASYVLPPSVNLRVMPLGIALVVAGFATAFVAQRIFRREGTELNPVSESNKLLIVHGPYRFTRNPMYLSLIVLTTGIAFMVGSWPMFVVPVLIFVLVRTLHIPMEEAKMRRQFGASYDAYTRDVRRWI